MNYFNFFLILCLLFMFIGVFIGLSGYNWLIMWLGMEITLMSFIPCLILEKSIIESYSSLKYFSFQCLGSSLFILGSMDFFFLEFLIIGLLIKLGFFPNHFWILGMSKGLNWFNFFLLMSLQKILPLIFLIYVMSYFFVSILPLIFLNSLMGNLGSLNQMDLRKFLVYSSMNHMTWMIISSMMNFYFFIYYLLGYIFLLMLFTLLMYKKNTFYFNQLFYFSNFNIYSLFLFPVVFFSFLGFPPFLGFFMKIFSIFSSYMMFYFWIMLLLIINLIISFAYIRLFIFMFLYNYRSTLEENFSFFFMLFILNFFFSLIF